MITRLTLGYCRRRVSLVSKENWMNIEILIPARRNNRINYVIIIALNRKQTISLSTNFLSTAISTIDDVTKSAANEKIAVFS